MQPIAVIGMSCLFPGAKNTSEFWQNLVQENNSCTTATLSDLEANLENFLAEKNIIIKILKPIKNNSYGNDYIFGAMLKKNKIDVSHINNPVIVNNVDVNEVFLKKTKDALKNLTASQASVINS